MENKTNEVKVVPSVTTTKERIDFLKAENTNLKKVVEENRDTFKKWINENFIEPNFNGDYVELADDNNSYHYRMEDEYLRMKKTIRPSRSRGGFGGFGGFGMHPMEMMEMMMYEQMEKKQIEHDEVVYEGGYQPKLKVEYNMFPRLKEDLINKGEISNTIKKYIHEDRKMRVELENQINTNKNEISKLETENRKALQEAVKAEFTKEKVAEMFKNRVTLVNGEKYTLCDQSCDTVKTLTFKKETPEKYFLEFVFTDEEEKVLGIEKKKFKISNYINM